MIWQRRVRKYTGGAALSTRPMTLDEEVRPTKGKVRTKLQPNRGSFDKYGKFIARRRQNEVSRMLPGNSTLQTNLYQVSVKTDA